MPGPVVKHLFEIKVVDRHHCKDLDERSTRGAREIKSTYTHLRGARLDIVKEGSDAGH